MDDVMVDFGRGSGSGGDAVLRMIRNNGDYNAFRPYIGDDGRSYVTKNVAPKGQKPVYEARLTNNTAFLRRDDWLRIDRDVMQIAKPTLKAVSDLRSRGLTKNIDGMATPILAYETMSDITGATVSMNGLRESERDRPVMDIATLPIPIIHKDLSFSARGLAVAERGANPIPLSSATIARATRRCAEKAEDMVIGNGTPYYYGGGYVYGYTNQPNRVTKAMTLPTAVGWTPETFTDEISDLKQLLVDDFHPGPYVMYISSNWGKYLDRDYSAVYPGVTLRDRTLKFDGITSIQTLDYLTGYQVLLIQMTADVVELVVGMDFRVIQWEGMGGMEVNWKVLGILVPWLKNDMDLNSGIGHGTAS